MSSQFIRQFPDIAWDNLATEEMADRRREAAAHEASVTPDLAQRVADLSFSYPNLSGGQATGMALAGIEPLTPEAEMVNSRNEQLRAAGFETVQPSEGFWDAGLGSKIKGFTRGAFTFFESLYDEVVKGGTAFLHEYLARGRSASEAARSSFGFSPGALAIANLQQGRPVNLGSGFFGGGDLSPETQRRLDAGVPFMEAIRNPEQMEMGLPLRQFSENLRARNFAKVPGTEDIVDARTGYAGLTITPGRLGAAAVTEPGTNAFNQISGLADAAANIFLDPADRLGGFVGDIRRSNQALSAAGDSLVSGGPRLTLLARNVDDWLNSRHGDTVARFIAETDDFLTLHGMFRRNATRSNVDANFIATLTDTTDVAEVKQLISGLAHSGYEGGKGFLTELPVKQGLIGRATGTSGLGGIVARGLGRGGGAVDVLGLRGAIRMNRDATSWMGRMAAEVGATALRSDDISTAVDDFGQWMQAAGLSPSQISRHMKQMADIQPGQWDTMPRMWGTYKAAVSDVADKMIEEGLSPTVANAFTQVFDTIDDYRKFWLDENGAPMLFTGGKYRVMMGGQVFELPSAQLFSEFMERSIPLIDMRKIRQGLRRSKWAQLGFEDLALKKLQRRGAKFSIETMEGFDDLGPGVIGSLMNDAMQKVWKPLVLLRPAWPVRVIAEEQVRSLAAGLDSLVNHPMKAMAIISGKKLGTDLKGNEFVEAAAHRAALSKRGLEHGLGRPRVAFNTEWLKVEKSDPRYWDGLAIYLQQLADDPIVQRIANAMIEADEFTPLTDVLRPLKDEFFDESTELGQMRLALAADSSNWKIVNVQEQADKVIDDRLARILQVTGGDAVMTNHLDGTYMDLYQHKIVRDQETGDWVNSVTGQRYDLPEHVDPPKALEVRVGGNEVRSLRAQVEGLRAKADAAEPTFETLDDLEEVARNLEMTEKKLLDIQRQGTGLLEVSEFRDSWEFPSDVADFIRDNSDALLRGDSATTRELGFMLDETTEMLTRAERMLWQRQYPNRAQTPATDIIELSRDPEMLRTRFAGLESIELDDGSVLTLDDLAERSNRGWTHDEIKDMMRVSLPRGAGRYHVRQLTPSQMARVYDDPTDPKGFRIFHQPQFAAGPDQNMESVLAVRDGWVVGELTLRRSASDGRVVDVELFQVAKGDNRTAWYDPTTGDAVTSEIQRKAMRAEDGIAPVGRALPGERGDAGRLLRYALDPDNQLGIDTEALYDLAFGGVPIRDWLESAGVRPEGFTFDDIAEFMRAQYGARWTDATEGPLGRFPTIAVTNDGATALARAIEMNANGRLTDFLKAEDITDVAQGWPQRHIFTHEIAPPDFELLNAVASGRLGDLTVSMNGALDEVDRVNRISEIAGALREGWGEQIGRFPNFTKVAREADPEKLDSALDHLFDMFMSKPTNVLSRSPAFKQFYWRRVSEMLPFMDDATKAEALQAAADAGIGRGEVSSMIKAAFKGSDPVEEGLSKLADDFIANRLASGTGDLTSLDQADEIAKAFALQETKRLLYDLTKKTQFFDMMRVAMPFGEAWYEIMTTWARLINENPAMIRKFQRFIEGARQEGFFYNDPATGEEVFAMPHIEALGNFFGLSQGDEQANPEFTGRVEGVNLILNNFLPGLGPVVQIPAARFGRDLLDKPELRWARNLIFPFGYPETDTPGAIVNSTMPAWFRKAMTSIGNPAGDDERLYNNTVIDVLRAMELNGEIPANLNPAGRAEILEEARSRARKLYLVRSASQFLGPTGAQVRWDVEVDPDGTAFAYQVLATEYRQMLEENEGDRVQAFNQFVNTFGFDPGAIVTAKTEQTRPRSVTEAGIDFQNENPELFRDYELTAYYVAPDPPEGEFSYNAYLSQLREGDRVPLTPEQWWTERNRLLGSVAYEKVRRAAVARDIRNEPEVSAYLRAYRYNLMATYPGYGFENVGAPGQPEQRQFMAEFERWRDDPKMAQTNAGQGLVRYLAARDRALHLASVEYGVSREGFANAKSTAPLRQYLLNVGYSLTKQFPDFGTIFQRHYLWEVEEPEPVVDPNLLGVDLSTPESEL